MVSAVRPRWSNSPPGWAELIDRALKIAGGGEGRPLRRSRQAATFRFGQNAALRRDEVFIKLLDAPRGLKAVRRLCVARGRVRAILDALVAAGFAAAPVLMLGDERGSGRTLMVTARVAGDVPRFLRVADSGAARRREMLRALGAEVARLHRAGFVHGDLTPYNIFVARGAPVRFT